MFSVSATSFKSSLECVLQKKWDCDWAHWTTSDLDLLITRPYGTLDVSGATSKSPEAALISDPGNYALAVNGYQIYFDKTEHYFLEILYFASSTPLWSSPTFNLGGCAVIESPAYSLAVVWLHDKNFALGT